MAMQPTGGMAAGFGRLAVCAVLAIAGATPSIGHAQGVERSQAPNDNRETIPVQMVAYVVPPNAVYPTASRRAGEQGTVVLRALVDRSGTPSQVLVKTSSGYSALDESAVNAVRAARFRPYAKAGVAEEIWVLVPITFTVRITPSAPSIFK